MVRVRAPSGDDAPCLEIIEAIAVSGFRVFNRDSLALIVKPLAVFSDCHELVHNTKADRLIAGPQVGGKVVNHRFEHGALVFKPKSDPVIAIRKTGRHKETSFRAQKKGKLIALLVFMRKSKA